MSTPALRTARPAGPARPDGAAGPVARALFAAVAAVLVLLGAVVASPGAANAADGEVTWGVRTATNDQGNGRQNYTYTVDPGGQISDALVISNHGATDLALDVYGADGFTTTSGQLDVLPKGQQSVALGSWVALGTTSVQVPAGGEIEVPFTVTVPADATPGDYAGAVLTSLTQAPQEQGINVDRRLGIRMKLRVGGDLAPALAIENLHVDYAGTPNPFGTGDATVSYTIHNTGNVRLSAAQAVSVAGPFGLFRVDASAVEPAPELLPGETWEMTVPIAGAFPAFLLSATTTVTPELAPEISPEQDQDAGLVVVQASADTVAVPWALLILVLLVAAIVVGTILVTRRRRRRAKELEKTRVAEAVAAALATRAAEEQPAAR